MSGGEWAVSSGQWAMRSGQLPWSGTTGTFRVDVVQVPQQVVGGDAKRSMGWTTRVPPCDGDGVCDGVWYMQAVEWTHSPPTPFE